MTNELPDNVTEQLKSETFDVLEFVTGSNTPRTKIKLYTDNESGHRLAELVEQEKRGAEQAATEGLSIADEVEWADPEEIEMLREKVESTALTVNLRGLAPKAKTALRASLVAKHNYKESAPVEDNEPYFEEYTYTLIAKTISGVVRADGAIDDRPWDADRVKTLRERLNETEFQRLDAAVYGINFNTDIFDRAASADFLSKR